uniref:Sec-independent protein translocase component TatC n=1 Tax=Tetraselmis marina TaxID=41888 RepID=UPI0021820F8E|nr:Sec-independent protein translocase component TatC [Tetraselmis marina]UVF37905.1 Sec-independent protein translocase component TatC [Tetraselmis marina]
MTIFTFYIQEIKFRLFYTFLSFTFLFFSSCFELHPVLYYLTKPLKNLKVMLTDLPEMYFTMFCLSCYISFFFVFPIFLYNIWAFLGPSLTKHERREFNFFFFISSFNSILTHCIALCLFVPFVINVFFIAPIGSFFIEIECFPKLYPYTQLVMKIFSGLFCLFQIPAFLFLASKFQLVSSKFIAENRKISFILITFTSALVSPPDVISQLYISILGFTIYELMLIYILFKKFSFHTLFLYKRKKKNSHNLSIISAHQR